MSTGNLKEKFADHSGATPCQQGVCPGRCTVDDLLELLKREPKLLQGAGISLSSSPQDWLLWLQSVRTQGQLEGCDASPKFGPVVPIVLPWPCENELLDERGVGLQGGPGASLYLPLLEELLRCVIEGNCEGCISYPSCWPSITDREGMSESPFLWIYQEIFSLASVAPYSSEKQSRLGRFYSTFTKKVQGLGYLAGAEDEI